jgi:hypothetical protein
MVGIHGIDLGDGIMAGTTGVGTHGIVGIDLGDGAMVGITGVGIMVGTTGDGTHGMDVLIWDGAIISTMAMCIMATTGITVVGTMVVGIMAETIQILFMEVVKVDH